MPSSPACRAGSRPPKIRRASETMSSSRLNVEVAVAGAPGVRAIATGSSLSGRTVSSSRTNPDLVELVSGEEDAGESGGATSALSGWGRVRGWGFTSFMGFGSGGRYIMVIARCAAGVEGAAFSAGVCGSRSSRTTAPRIAPCNAVLPRRSHRQGRLVPSGNGSNRRPPRRRDAARFLPIPRGRSSANAGLLVTGRSSRAARLRRGRTVARPRATSPCHPATARTSSARPS